jgi:hypothetical protein
MSFIDTFQSIQQLLPYFVQEFSPLTLLRLYLEQLHSMLSPPIALN